MTTFASDTEQPQESKAPPRSARRRAREFVLQGFEGGASMLRYIAGAVLMGFGGMLAGYLFCDRSPLRRLYLKLRLKRIQAETEALRREQSSRAAEARSRLRVIKGGAGKNDEDDDPKRYLN